MRIKLICNRWVAGAMIVACVFGVISVHVAAQQQDVVGPEQWPTTVEGVVRDLMARMPAEDKERVKTTKKNDLIQFHHGAGTWIRNYYGLWGGNEKLMLSACGAPCHPDDASMKIIEAIWQELQK